jgi:hypothetical protein
MNQLKSLASLIIILASVVLCRQIIVNSNSNHKNKIDYAELNHVKYGLFSVDEWKRQITVILAEEINKLYLSKANERMFRKHIEDLLNTLIDKIDKKIREENAESAEGRIKQVFMNIFVNVEDVKKGIPEYADAIIQEMKKTKITGQLKAMLNKQLEQYFDQTHDTRDTAQLSRILLRIDSGNIESARLKLNKAIAADHDLIVRETILLVLLSIVLFALSGFSKQPLSPSHYSLLVLSLIILLTAGITTPMIDMEAKVSKVSFLLMGHSIHFENQLLYFQSKSILDVFWIMIAHEELQMKFVGVLLITFSIVFPLLKIILSAGYFYNYHHARENAVINFFVLKSGKWSMADVMVIAMGMAYIGFNGMINSQFGELRSASRELELVTTNGTALQPGFYLFLTYTLLALILSGFLARKPQPAK